MARRTVGSMKGDLQDVQRNMGAALSKYADYLIEESASRPLEKTEWLAAFLGKSWFAQDERPRLMRETETTMRVRHALGEPILSFSGVHMGEMINLITRPDDYDPLKPDTFFQFGLEKNGARYVGTIACSVVESAERLGTSKVLYSHSTANLLSVSRIASSLSVDVVPSLYQEGSQGFIYGTPAIRESGSQYPDANRSVLAVIDRVTSSMREYAGETAMMPSLAR